MTAAKQSSPYYPMFLNISGQRCTVVGGGQVALRKARMLLEFGGSVDVVSPEVCADLEQLAGNGQVRVFRRAYQPSDVTQAAVVIAATDDATINRAVARDARWSGTLVNVVDDAEASDFIAPSYVRRGDITLAISTSGRSPALARKLRVRLEEEFGDEYARLALLVGDLRTELKHEGLGVDGDAWQAALDIDTLIDLLRKGQEEEARAAILDALKARQVG